MSDVTDPVAAFIDAACAPHGPGHSSHASGTLDEADAILAVHPDLGNQSVHVAAILGDEMAVRRHLATDPGLATGKGGPSGWDPLTHLCFSRYLRLDPARSDGFVRAATALIDAGANANTGFFEAEHQPRPEWESAIYGAAGVAHHAALTQLLLDRGADPNDGETPYHAPESYDNAALSVLVGSGKLSDISLTTMLLRKADWHDEDGIRFLLASGANPNQMTHWGFTALHQALRRDNRIEIITAMLDHGGDPTLVDRHGRSAVSTAARRGRADALALFAERGIATELSGVERLIAACTMHDTGTARAIADPQPQLLSELLSQGGQLLAEFAGTGNSGAVQALLDLGVPVTALYDGDGYFGIPRQSTALHVAAWRARHDTVKLLLLRGAAVDALDGDGRIPLELAVRACTDSYWMERRSPESIVALLEAGSRAARVPIPTGYDLADALLRRYRASA